MDFPVTVTFLLLSVDDRGTLKERMVARLAKEDHYMRSTMVDSQLDILEQPTLSEGDVLTVDASQDKAQMLQQVEETVRGLLKA